MQVMCVPGVVPELTRSNNILEVERCLGVEAARRVVIDELLAVMEGHGVEVNIRHVMLLADLMTNRVCFFPSFFHILHLTFLVFLKSMGKPHEYSVVVVM